MQASGNVPSYDSKTKKEGVSRTYKGCDGYAPMMAYIGREGYLINCELRKGSQYCQKHTPEFLRETIVACRRVTKEPLLFRLDSGNESTTPVQALKHCARLLRRRSQHLPFVLATQAQKRGMNDLNTFSLIYNPSLPLNII